MRTADIGDVVFYTLDSADAEAVLRNRQNSHALPGMPTGNTAAPYTTYAATVVRAFEDGTANLQVSLDGPDVLWVTSRREDAGTGEQPEPGTWTHRPRREGER